MIGIFTAIVIGGSIFLWLSHRVYLTYAHVVAREERDRLRRGVAPVQPVGHIGPLCFTALNLVVLFALVIGLESLTFDTGEFSGLRRLFLALTHFSGVIALWMLLEGRHLAFFYNKIGQALSGEKRRSNNTASSLPRFWRRNLKLAFFAMVATPLLLEVVGVRMGEASKESVLLLFGACFLMPQVGLFAFLVHQLQPLRRHAGVR